MTPPIAMILGAIAISIPWLILWRRVEAKLQTQTWIADIRQRTCERQFDELNTERAAYARLQNRLDAANKRLLEFDADHLPDRDMTTGRFAKRKP